jgi:very-short-patch-repair endonuclease
MIDLLWWNIVPHSDYTKQELIVGKCLDEIGLRYHEQRQIGKYYVDFLVEDTIVVEADGIFGHYTKADQDRDEALLELGVEQIFHIKGQTKKEIYQELQEFLCQNPT